MIGVGVGTVVFDDLANCDAMFFFGQNTGSNSPRFLHPLQDAAKPDVWPLLADPTSSLDPSPHSKGPDFP